MKLFFRISIFFLFFIYPSRHNSQVNDTILSVIELDSISIEASKAEELDINAFISMMIHDESFYTAFKNLRTASYNFKNEILILKKDRQTVQAAYQSEAYQEYLKPCRSMVEKPIQVVGDYFDSNHENKWYTSKLYDRLFFTHGKVCIDSSKEHNVEPDKMEGHVRELKKLIFAPGTRSHVPLLGDKTAIFDEEMQPYYDYRFRVDTIESQPYYLFEVEVKPLFKVKGQNKTVIKKLQTWFTTDTHQIIRRDYQLVGNTIAYSFDVTMHVDVINVRGRFFPSFIQYDGTWKIFSKKRENAKFTISFNDFKF